jgi:hypothetical protein
MTHGDLANLGISHVHYHINTEEKFASVALFKNSEVIFAQQYTILEGADNDMTYSFFVELAVNEFKRLEGITC